MDDLIRRQDAIMRFVKASKNYECGMFNLAEVTHELWDIASTQTEQQRWIPVSEQLPEDDTPVFVYLFESNSPYIAWVSDCEWFTEDFQVEKEYEPIAWMPLPEPYKAESEDKE